MFPGANPGEWEPVKIRTKVTTKPKVVEAIPTIEPAEPVPIEVDTKTEAPADGESQEIGSVGQQADGEQSKPEQAEAEQPKVERDDAEQPPTIEQPNGEEPKVEQQDGNQPSGDDLNGVPVTKEDVEMKEAPPAEEGPKPETQDTEMDQVPVEQPQPQAEPGQEEPSTTTIIDEETTESFEDDHWSTEGAVYPIVAGRIENWSCFFALLSHIYNMTSPPFHMPVLFVAQPCWSARDHEMITQYVFENWKIPAFCLMDSALTACYAYGVPTALVVDVGHEKCDVSAVTEFQVNDIGRGPALAECGGRSMTRRLLQVLEKQGFDEDMAEQLKKSPICEILPPGTPYPKATPNGKAAPALNPAAAASTGALDSGAGAKDEEGLRPGQAPRGPGVGTTVGEEGVNGEDEDNDGVLDIAAIVARDNAAEVLAKREREKAEKAAAKKASAGEGPRAIRLRNSERERATFTYVDYVPLDEESVTEQPLSRKRKREIEVGVERFMAANPAPGTCDGIIDVITEAMHHAVLSVPDIPQRANLWDNIIILGNGSRIRGTTPPSLHLPCYSP
jgi:actin-related protein 9